MNSLKLWNCSRFDFFDKEFKCLKTHDYPTLAQSKYCILEKHVLCTSPRFMSARNAFPRDKP